MSLSPPALTEAQWNESIRRRELRRYAATIGELADRVQLTEDFTTETPRKLSRVIKETALLLEKCIPSAPAESLAEVNEFLGRIAAHLRYVERARVTQTPWSVVQTAEDFLKRLAGSNSNFIIRPSWSYNYSLVGEFLDFYQRVLGCWSWFPRDELGRRAGFEQDETIYCLSFPRVERDNCLLHANWGHEVGHIFAGRWIDKEFGELWSKGEKGMRGRIQAKVRENPPPVDPLFEEIAIDQLVSLQMSTAMDAARRGLTELICDLIGVHLFGPSALV